MKRALKSAASRLGVLAPARAAYGTLRTAAPGVLLGELRNLFDKNDGFPHTRDSNCGSHTRGCAAVDDHIIVFGRCEIVSEILYGYK